MGWIWLIPTFHIPQPSLMRNGGGMTPTRTTLRLKRKEVDFPVGLGAGIVDVEISLEWVMPDGSQEHEESTTTFKLSKKEGESIKPPASDN
jgi:phosphatidylinositol-3,4,5-trisphosphate 3-phosphatase/dual-specificity protein phosphatase PTEN